MNDKFIPVSYLTLLKVGLSVRDMSSLSRLLRKGLLQGNGERKNGRSGEKYWKQREKTEREKKAASRRADSLNKMFQKPFLELKRAVSWEIS